MNQNWFFTLITTLLISCYVQRVNADAFFFENKTNSIEKKKLYFWQNQIKNNSKAERMESLFNENEEKKIAVSFHFKLLLHTILHLQKVQKPVFVIDSWNRNVFNPMVSKEQLIELLCDNNLESIYGQNTLISIWIALEKEHPVLSNIGVRYLLSFNNTYLRKRIFTSLTALKIKHRSLLDVKDYLRFYNQASKKYARINKPTRCKD